MFSKEEGKKPSYPKETNLSIPTSGEKIRELMQNNPDLFDMSLVSNSYDRYLEVALGYWLTNGNTSFNSHDYYTYGQLLGGEQDPTDNADDPNYQGKNRLSDCLLFLWCKSDFVSAHCQK